MGDQDPAQCQPNAPQKKMVLYVQRSGFDGIAPLPKEVSSTVANARRLAKVWKG
jgi:hypothetical protein